MNKLIAIILLLSAACSTPHTYEPASRLYPKEAPIKKQGIHLYVHKAAIHGRTQEELPESITVKTRNTLGIDQWVEFEEAK